MKRSFYGSLCDIFPIFEVEDKIMSTNMKCPLKRCGVVGHKTFTPNHCYCHRCHKNVPKPFFPWLIVSFDISKTSTTNQMISEKGVPLFSCMKT